MYSHGPDQPIVEVSWLFLIDLPAEVHRFYALLRSALRAALRIDGPVSFHVALNVVVPGQDRPIAVRRLV